MHRSISPDSVMSSGQVVVVRQQTLSCAGTVPRCAGHHVPHKGSHCYQLLLMSSPNGGQISELAEDEEEGKAGMGGCCCSSEHQLNGAEEVEEVEGELESKIRGFAAFWEELKGDRLDLILLLFLYTLQVTRTHC